MFVRQSYGGGGLRTRRGAGVAVVTQRLVVLELRVVLEETHVLRLPLRDALHHLLQFRYRGRLLGVNEDCRLLTADHEKHVLQVAKSSLIDWKPTGYDFTGY